jgi:hypothetical protein
LTLPLKRYESVDAVSVRGPVIAPAGD